MGLGSLISSQVDIKGFLKGIVRKLYELAFAKEIADRDALIADYKQKADASDARIAALDAQIGKLTEAKKALEADISAHEVRYETLSKENERLLGEGARLAGQVKNYEDKAAAQKRAIDAQSGDDAFDALQSGTSPNAEPAGSEGH